MFMMNATRKYNFKPDTMTSGSSYPAAKSVYKRTIHKKKLNNNNKPQIAFSNFFSRLGTSSSFSYSNAYNIYNTTSTYGMHRALSTNRDSSAYTQIRKNNAIGKTSTSVKNPVKFNSYSPSYVKSKLKQTRNIGYVVPTKCNFHTPIKC